MKRLVFLIPMFCMLFTAPEYVSAQRHDAGQNLTDQSFAYSGDLDALYQFSNTNAPAPSDSQNNLHVLVKSGKFRMSFKTDGMQYDTMITKDRTLSQQGGVKYNFNKPHPQSLIGMPPLPVNFDAVTFLKVKPESYYILQAGSTYGLAKPDPSGKSDLTFDPSYFPATVALDMKEGAPMVAEIRVGDKAIPLRIYRYSDHRKLGNAWMPGRIECQYLNSTPPATCVYTLKSMRTTVASEHLDYERALKKGDLVQSENGKSVVSFTYDPNRSLEDQHAVAAASAKRLNDELTSEQKQRRYNSSTLLVILGVGLILLWYARRRMSRGREEMAPTRKRADV